MAVTNILCQTKVFEEALNVVKFLGWLKKFRPAQNILGPVKGQGIKLLVWHNLGIMTLFKGFMQRCCKNSCKNEPRLGFFKSSKMYDPFNVNWRNFVGRKDFLNFE